ncbi:hypothetical protein GE061_018927 [Apolygus lucorum]|uniref:Uncharacterized protein n=1 Tax=Apolygus lucorum TaxID=248454 RepID=A0A6A4JFA5_APOLU|nr:hypothetical protein GE061_018927 [Apolygus lucorum]
MNGGVLWGVEEEDEEEDVCCDWRKRSGPIQEALSSSPSGKRKPGKTPVRKKRRERTTDRKVCERKSEELSLERDGRFPPAWTRRIPGGESHSRKAGTNVGHQVEGRSLPPGTPGKATAPPEKEDLPVTEIPPAEQ